MFRDNHHNALACLSHPRIKATSVVVRFDKITKRFRSYEEASRFLNGLRFKTDENTFDERDYRRDNPLGFSNISAKWLEYKRDDVKPGTYKGIRRHIEIAQGFFKNVNVKDIRYGHLEDFIRTVKLSNKTRHNIMSTLHSCFVWLKRRQEIKELPEFPAVSYELGTRTTVSKDIQGKIIDEIIRIAPFRVWLGVKFLSTYISIRPGELLSLTEGDIDLDNAYLYIKHPKEKKYKAVPIIPGDVEILRDLPATFPAMPLFRHEGGVQGCREGQPYGEKYLYKWWLRACKNLNIDGVDLYGGTRHSSARALRKYRTPEEIKRATMHTTNKAFERYFGMESNDLREIYMESAKVMKIDNADNGLITEKVT
jgi:integrase